MMKDLANQIAFSPNAEAAAEIALTVTDWTQIPNSGLTSDCVDNFATYRSAVRIIRREKDAENKPPSEFTWPSVPTEEWA